MLVNLSTLVGNLNKRELDKKWCPYLLVWTYSMQLARQACFDPQGISSVALRGSILLTHAYKFFSKKKKSVYKKVSLLSLFVLIFVFMH